MSISTFEKPIIREAAPVLKFTTVLIGKLNDESISIAGSGTIDEANGYTEGIFELQQLPERVDPRAFGAFLFTGYPNSCRTENPEKENPFSGGSYSYSRVYNFTRSGAVTTLSVNCDLNDSHKLLDSVFEVQGDLPLFGAVSGVSPIYELWSPTTSNIEGLFNVAWLADAKYSVLETATAVSSYNAVHKEILHGKPVFRSLELNSEVIDRTAFRVTQSSSLISG